VKRNEAERRNVIICTKVCGGMGGTTPNHSGLSRSNIIASVQDCLQRLQVNYIDVLYFHKFDPSVPVEESLSAIEDLVSKGRVRYFAVSNFTVDRIRPATAYR
jgi:aryl-alcohol dehydrogenase-like predicted oxidoreductase